MMFRVFLFVALCACVPTAATAQTNFSFFVGATSLSSDLSEKSSIGASVGLITKFNVIEHVLIRSQIYVDKVQVEDVAQGDFRGNESVTMVCLGFGGEVAVGGRDVDVYISATPHGTIRTSFRTVDKPNGDIEVVDLTRFSLGLLFGVGVEWFITDNIGIELQGQYDIYNFDHDQNDPIRRGLRGLAGLQFYLGRNFAR